MSDLPPILTSAQLLAELNANGHVMSSVTLWKRACNSTVYRSCLIDTGCRTFEWSRARLIKAGILMGAPAKAEIIQGPTLAFSFRSQVVG